MKRPILFCFILLLGVYFLTSCEDRTKGLLPSENALAKDTPPKFVIEAIMREYPNATGLKVTTIKPNLFWKAEFYINDVLYEAYIDEFAKFQIGARLAASDKPALFKILTYLQKLREQDNTIGTFKLQSGKLSISVQISKLLHYQNRKLLNYSVQFGNYNAYLLFDVNGNLVKEFRYTKTGLPVMDTKNLTCEIYNWDDNQITFDYFPKEIDQRLNDLGWYDYSGITPLLSSKDYPTHVNGYLQAVPRVFKNANKTFYSYGIVDGMNSPDAAFFVNYASSGRRQYQKFFDEIPIRYSLFIDSNANPIYVKETLFEPFYEVTTVTEPTNVPPDILNASVLKNYPQIKNILLYETVEYFGPDYWDGKSSNRYKLVYNGDKGEFVQITLIGDSKNLYMASINKPVDVAEIPEGALNRLQSQYPGFKILSANKADYNDRIRGAGRPLDYSYMEVFFEHDEKKYVGYINDLINKPFEIIVGKAINN